MTLFYIALLIVLGILFLVAELVLLPGVSVGAVLALVSYGTAGYLAFTHYSTLVGAIVVVTIIVLSLIATVISLRAKTWQRFSLNQKINSSSMPTTPKQEIKIGDRGVTVSRLAPMGKIEIKDKIYEAKSLAAYVDPKREIEVIGFENFSVLVKTVSSHDKTTPAAPVEEVDG